MSRYTRRYTIAVPESLIAAANQLALAIGESVNDDETFKKAEYQDAEGNLYALASTVAVESFLPIATGDLEAAAIDRFGEDHPVDLALAHQAQVALRINEPAAKDVIAVSDHPDPAQAIIELDIKTAQSEEDEFSI